MTESVVDTKRLYVVYTLTGSEKKAKLLLEEELSRASEAIQELFGRIVVPTEKVKSAGRTGRVREIVKFPGYLFVEVTLNDETESVIISTNRIRQIDKKPIPRIEAMQLLGDRIEEEEVSPVVEVDFSPGDLVRVVAGPFENMTAEVEEIAITRGKLKVKIDMFGRPTTVELDFNQVITVNER